LVDEEGRDVFQETQVGGKPAMVGVLFADRELAREFSADAHEYGMDTFVGLEPWELKDWGMVEVFAKDFYVATQLDTRHLSTSDLLVDPTSAHSEYFADLLDRKQL
jgi:hypothetical protein